MTVGGRRGFAVFLGHVASPAGGVPPCDRRVGGGGESEKGLETVTRGGLFRVAQPAPADPLRAGHPRPYPSGLARDPGATSAEPRLGNLARARPSGRVGFTARRTGPCSPGSAAPPYPGPGPLHRRLTRPISSARRPWRCSAPDPPSAPSRLPDRVRGGRYGPATRPLRRSAGEWLTTSWSCRYRGCRPSWSALCRRPRPRRGPTVMGPAAQPACPRSCCCKTSSPPARPPERRWKVFRVPFVPGADFCGHGFLPCGILEPGPPGCSGTHARLTRGHSSSIRREGRSLLAKARSLKKPLAHLGRTPRGPKPDLHPAAPPARPCLPVHRRPGGTAGAAADRGHAAAGRSRGRRPAKRCPERSSPSIS